MGILSLSETLETYTDVMRGNATHEIGQAMRAYQREAAFSVAQMTECVLNLPIEESFNLHNGLASETPITAYHVTPSIMTTAIDKAIRHIVSLRISTPAEAEMGDEDPDSLSDNLWRKQMDYLMKGLLSLEVTIGGSQAVGYVLKALMREYGDMISECWSSDFDS